MRSLKLILILNLFIALNALNAFAADNAKISRSDIAEIVRGASRGEAEAQCALGIMYLGGVSVKQDDKQAFNYIKQAADKGVEFALYQTGLMYARGRGVNKNLNQAIKYLNKVLNLNSLNNDFAPYANYELGLIYEAQNNLKQAFNYYKNSADSGYAPAQCVTGLLYAANKNYKQAEFYFSQAATQGELDAQRYLNYLK